MSGDPQSAILVYLLENYPDSATIRTLSDATGFSTTAIRNNLGVMASRRSGVPWIEKGTAASVRGAVYSLTSKGHEVAGFRAATRERRNA